MLHPAAPDDDWTAGAVVGWPVGLLTSLSPLAALLPADPDVPAGVAGWACGAILFVGLAAASLPVGLMAGWAAVRFRDARRAAWPSIPTAAAGAYLAAASLGVAGLLRGLLT